MSVLLYIAELNTFIYFISCRIQFLRHIRDFFQVMFKVEPETKSEDEEGLQLGGDKLILTCVGVGYANVSKAIS